MKLPTASQLAELIREAAKIVEVNYGSTHWSEFSVTERELPKLAEKILDLIKIASFEEASELPEIDPNLIRIAELEAKIKVYESVITSAGIKLGLPSKKTEIGFAPRKEK